MKRNRCAMVDVCYEARGVAARARGQCLFCGAFPDGSLLTAKADRLLGARLCSGPDTVGRSAFRVDQFECEAHHWARGLRGPQDRPTEIDRGRWR